MSVCTRLCASLWRRKCFSTLLTWTFHATMFSPSRGSLAMTKNRLFFADTTSFCDICNFTDNSALSKRSVLYGQTFGNAGKTRLKVRSPGIWNYQVYAWTHRQKSGLHRNRKNCHDCRSMAPICNRQKVPAHRQKSGLHRTRTQDHNCRSIAPSVKDATKINKNAWHHAPASPTVVVVCRELGSPTESLWTIFALQSWLLVNEWVLFQSSLWFSFVGTRIAQKEVLHMCGGYMLLQVLRSKVRTSTDFTLVITFGCMHSHMPLQSKTMSKLFWTLVTTTHLPHVDRRVNVMRGCAFECSYAMCIFTGEQTVTDFDMPFQLHTWLINSQMTNTTHIHQSFSGCTMLLTKDTSETQRRLQSLWDLCSAVLLVPCVWCEDRTWATHGQKNILFGHSTRCPFPLRLTHTWENPARQHAAHRWVILRFLAAGKHFSWQFGTHRRMVNGNSALCPIGLWLPLENAARKQHTPWCLFTAENPPGKQGWQGETLNKHGQLQAQGRESNIQRQAMNAHLAILLELVTNQLWLRLWVHQLVLIPHTTVNVRAGITRCIVAMLHISIDQHADFANYTLNSFILVRSQ